ncbi:hypothetical protein CI109_107299 [Kwoniella shandongensis]|uniref:CAMK protein kinase n=1 Tax=Kwoniella shandongensis TaxID=1734106 RepID=A0AAJ8MZ47_9TREE
MSQSQSQFNDYAFEPTQLSQPYYSQTQGTQGTAFANSQVEPRRKYWAVFISTSADRGILKIPWSKPAIQIGRGPYGLSKNDVVLPEKRVSNIHCRFTLGLQGPNGSGSSSATVQSWKDGEAEPEVWVEDLKSSNGTFRAREASIWSARYMKDIRCWRGQGTFAEVRKAVDVETGNMRAIKREIEISRSLEHENICRLIDWYEDPQHICLVLEYIDGGDLLEYVLHYPSDQSVGLPEAHAAELTVQLCRAMAYTGVTHRDLKPENILLTKETPDTPRMIKIADFVHAGTMLVSMVGTPQYLAPEVVMQTKQKQGYENVVDSWSVGIIVYSMLTKALPFDEDAELPVEQRIRARFTQPVDTALLVQSGISDLAIDFIMRLLAKDPAERMTMTEALEHEWLAGPSSQHSESQRYVLGGDSKWSIESFDDSNDDEEDVGEWSRPMTVSGTNHESAFEFGSEESFSQPMGNLHLDTPGLQSRKIDLANPRNTEPLPVSPPSPPLTADLDPNALQDGAAEVLPTPETSRGNGYLPKRKHSSQTPGELFSSGSLSPPPAVMNDLEMIEQAPDQPIVPPNSESTEAGGRKKTKGRMTATTESAIPTRQSPRNATRPRKSMRLA